MHVANLFSCMKQIETIIKSHTTKSINTDRENRAKCFRELHFFYFVFAVVYVVAAAAVAALAVVVIIILQRRRKKAMRFPC